MFKSTFDGSHELTTCIFTWLDIGANGSNTYFESRINKCQPNTVKCWRCAICICKTCLEFSAPQFPCVKGQYYTEGKALMYIE